MEPDKASSSAAPKRRKIERIGQDTAPKFYANNIEIQHTNFDFRLRFGLVESAGPDLVRVLDLAAVYMSPQHAKSVLDLLASQVASYEKKFGPVRNAAVVEATKSDDPKGE